MQNYVAAPSYRNSIIKAGQQFLLGLVAERFLQTYSDFTAGLQLSSHLEELLDSSL